MSQSGPGKIVLFDDFTGGEEILVAATTAPPMTVGNGTFSLVGQGLAETDSGAIFLDSDGLNGVLQLTTTDEDIHAVGLQTPIMFDVGLMGTIVAEARVRQAAITTGEFFFGFSDVQTDLAIIEGAIAHAATTTLTLTASDICGFISAPELTAAAEVHAIFNGGATHSREAVVCVNGMALKTETRRDPGFGGGADELFMTDEYGFAERSAGNWAFAHLSDATAPTS